MGPISRRPWTRQPQGPLRIDRNNPLGRKVLTAHVRGINVARGGAAAWSGTPGVKASNVGLLSSFDGSSYQDLKYLADITRPVTIAYFLKASSPPAYMGVAKISGTSGTNAFVIIRSTDAAYRLSCGYTDVGSIPLFGGVSNSFDGVAERTVITCAGGVGSNNSANYIAWINGSSFASVAGATFTTQSNDNSYLGWDGVDSKTAGLLDEFIIFDGVLSNVEIAAYYANPWQVFAPVAATPLVSVAASGTDTPVNPGVGTLTITGYAPTVAQSDNHAVTPGAGALTITGYAPTVAQTANQSVTPGVGNVTITGYAPTVTQDTAVAPGVGTLTITGYAPTVTQQINTPVDPGVGTLTITGYAPTVAQTANQSVVPGVGAVTITGYAPTVTQASASQNITPDAGAITITGYAPTVAQTVDTAGKGYRKKKQTADHGPSFADQFKSELAQLRADEERRERIAREDEEIMAIITAALPLISCECV